MKYLLVVSDRINQDNSFTQDFATRVECIQELVRLFSVESVERILDRLLDITEYAKVIPLDVANYGTVRVGIVLND